MDARKINHPVCVWAVALVFIAAAAVTAAQTDTPLPYGEPIVDRLAAGEQDVYTFTANRGEMLSFSVRAQDEGLDPVLRIQTAGGEEILSNDDYAYPDYRDALIEGLTIPGTGTYQAIVSGYGESTGTYELLMLRGYAELLASDAFDSIADWEVTDISAESSARSERSRDGLLLDLEGIQQFSTAHLRTTDVPTDAYTEVLVADAAGRNGWEAGLIFRRQDEGSFYRAMVSAQGTWRFDVYEDGVPRTIRGWNSHPAIVPGQTPFTLGVLAYETDFSFFVDGQYIGTYSDTTFTDAGRSGVAIGTANALGSDARVLFDDFLVSVPFQAGDEPVIPRQIIGGNSSDTIRELQRRRVIPAGGEIVLTLGESSARYSDAGVSRFPVARGSTFGDFVFGGTANWQTSADRINGCGLTFREQSDQEYALAFVDSTGGHGLSLRSEAGFEESIFFPERPSFPEGGPHRLVVIAIDETLRYYLNGIYVGELTTDLETGGIAEAVVNYDAVSTTCQFTDVWLWRWP